MKVRLAFVSIPRADIDLDMDLIPVKKDYVTVDNESFKVKDRFFEFDGENNELVRIILML